MKHGLVVDDSRIIRKVACSILAQLDFEADEAEDGDTAFHACRAQMPELILLDGNMPNSSGMEFLRDLRREPEGANPVVVVCLTENDLGQIKEAMLAGANDYLLKPFDQDSLTEKLAQIGLI